MRLRSLILALTVTASAQAQQVETPETVMRHFLQAVEQGRWADAAGFVIADPLAKQREEVLEQLRAPRRAFVPTAEFYMKMDSTMPRAVAEWNAQSFARRRAEERNDVLFTTEFADVNDTTNLKALSPAMLAARWLEGQDMRYVVRRGMQQSTRCRNAGALLMPPAPRYELLGVIARADTAFALHRQVPSPGDVKDAFPLHEMPLVILLVRLDAGWRILPQGPLLTPWAGALSSFDCIPSEPDFR